VGKRDWGVGKRDWGVGKREKGRGERREDEGRGSGYDRASAGETDRADKVNEVDRYQKNIIAYLRKNIEGEKPWFKGDFAVAVWDKLEKRLIAVRDHLGTRPFFYTETDEFFAFATEIKALFAISGVEKAVDEQWIADSICTVKSEKWRTAYKNIYRLLPAHILRFDGKETKLQRYWDLKVNPEWENLDEETAVKMFREKIHEAVKRRVRYARSVGSELSGGLDSSGVTALAFHHLKDTDKKFFALSHAFSERNLGKYFPYQDEREFSQALVEYSGIKEHVFCTGEGYGILDALTSTLAIQSGPTQQGYNIFADSLYDEAQKRDIRIILSGFGGDEGVTSKAGGYMQELARLKKWKQLKEYLRNTQGRGIMGRFKSILKYFTIRHFPGYYLKIKAAFGKADWRIPKWRSLAIDPGFMVKMNIKDRYFDKVGFPDDPDVRARQYKRIMHNHVSQRFEYSYLAALYRRMEYAYPLWDIDLLEFYYSLPSHLKIKNKMQRYIFREAMTGLLPEKIRLRNDKTGATVPTVQQRFIQDYENISKLVEEGKKNEISYFNYDKLKEWQERVRNRGFKDKMPANPGAFFNGLQVILWRRD
jgi:asparagine synthase (glutamine-hydrolysing)